MAKNFKVLPIQRTAIKPQVGERYTPKGYTQKMSSEGKIFGIVTVEKLPQPKVKPKDRICIFSDVLFENIQSLHQTGVNLEDVIIDCVENEVNGKKYINFEISI